MILLVKYLLLFKDGLPKPEDLENHMRLWDTWIGQIAQKGFFDSGLPFGPRAKVIIGPEKSVSDYVQKPGDVNGYVIVRADSMDEAVEIAKQAPNLALGGTVEIRSTVPPPQL